ncbi:hypothetical protein [Thermococcus sp.]|uniref:hypothetical protein n=1 Tax=Thermococcus sp. TaxID=35749 RepID=UPI002621E0DD|nr:hypothetical protein [Thermococcus sp.]
MKSGPLILGAVLVLAGLLLATWDYTSGTTAGCSVSPATTVMEVKIINVTNGGFVGGYVLAVGLPLDRPNVTVLDPESGCSDVYVRRNGLYYPLNLTCPFEMLRIKELGNGTARVYWQNPYTAIACDVPEFVPTPRGFLYVTTTEYPVGRGFHLEITKPKGVLEVIGQENFTVVLGNELVEFPSIDDEIPGTPVSLEIKEVLNGSSVLIRVNVRSNGTTKWYFHRVPADNSASVRIEKGFLFASLALYDGGSSEQCETRHSIGWRGAFLVMVGVSMFLIGRRER